MYTTRYIWQSFNFSTLYNQHDKQQKWKISMSCHSCGMCIGSFVEYSKRSEVWIVINQIVQSNIFFGKRVKYICINWSNAALNSLKMEMSIYVSYFIVSREIVGSNHHDFILLTRLNPNINMILQDNLIFNARFIWPMIWFNKIYHMNRNYMINRTLPF